MTTRDMESAARSKTAIFISMNEEINQISLEKNVPCHSSHFWQIHARNSSARIMMKCVFKRNKIKKRMKKVCKRIAIDYFNAVSVMVADIIQLLSMEVSMREKSVVWSVLRMIVLLCVLLLGGRLAQART